MFGDLFLLLVTYDINTKINQEDRFVIWKLTMNKQSKCKCNNAYAVVYPFPLQKTYNIQIELINNEVMVWYDNTISYGHLSDE